MIAPGAGTPRGGDPQRPAHLLLVEDDPALALMLTWELEERGIAVSLACTCSDARDLPAALGFDAALVDADLPDGDGVAPVETPARSHPGSTVAIHSGRHGVEEHLTAHPGPPVNLVPTKPVPVRRLMGLLDRLGATANAWG